MKKVIKIQLLIYTAIYLLSSFITWDLTWLPERVLHYTVYAADRTPGERTAVIFIAFFSVSQFFIWRPGKRDLDDAKTMSWVAIILQLLVFSALKILN